MSMLLNVALFQTLLDLHLNYGRSINNSRIPKNQIAGIKVT